MEGARGRKFFASEPRRNPAAPRFGRAEAEAEKFSFPFRKKSGARKIKNVEKIFLQGLAAVIGGGRRGGAIGFF
ncbi:MAG: hypothetical protein UV75_C0014G0011 [Candidatus Giovannonibacteria bacterium GW2011_GWA1_43_15]|nr:MAG: hypothetical protein UV75_C0014G0011 [Candidatus Giovannonibacteria bacterium GW2011_GWA1_43_15]